MGWIWVSVLMFALLATPGCAGRSSPPGRRAVPEGDALVTENERQTGVLFRGPVRNRVVPWVEGLTLVQSLVAANYLGVNDPRRIILWREGVPTEVPPADLLGGADLLVAPGDVVELIP